MKKYNQTLIPIARQLRSNMTDAEQTFWQRVRRKQILDIQFYRQKPIGNYIVDFYAPKVKLVIEIDGSQHLDTPNKIRDVERDRLRSSLGLKVLRFNNRQVLQEIESVLEIIYSVIKSPRAHSARPSLQKRVDAPFDKGGRTQSGRGDL